MAALRTAGVARNLDRANVSCIPVQQFYPNSSPASAHVPNTGGYTNAVENDDEKAAEKISALIMGRLESLACSRTPEGAKLINEYA